MKTMWIVIENSPGCLPESEPAEFTNRGEAEQYAMQLAREMREDEWIVVGNKRTGYLAQSRTTTAQRVIEITAVGRLMPTLQRATLEEGLRRIRPKVEQCRDALIMILSERDRLIGEARIEGFTVRQIEALVGVTNARITQIGKEQAR